MRKYIWETFVWCKEEPLRDVVVTKNSSAFIIDECAAVCIECL